METLVVIIIGIVLLGGAVALIVIGLRDSTDRVDPLQERLLEYASRGEVVNLEEIEMSQPFSERVMYPLARKFGEIATRFTPQNALQETARKLEKAGSPRGVDPTIFWAGRFVTAVAFGGLLLFVFSISSIDWTWGRRFFIVGVFTILGFYVPEMMLLSRIQRRQKEIRQAMPDALDLLTICVEAGLTFDGGMVQVYEKWDNELSRAFGRVLREIQLGKLRREALRVMSERVGIPEMTSFVAAIIQSEQLGVSIARVLRIQSDQMRVRRRQIAEEEAQKAPIKMLFPMGILIFPSILIILLGPAAIMLMQSALGTMFGW